MKFLVIITFALAAVLFACAWWFVRSADNTDSRALATLVYIFPIVVAGAGVVELVIWGIVRYFSLD